MISGSAQKILLDFFFKWWLKYLQNNASRNRLGNNCYGCKTVWDKELNPGTNKGSKISQAGTVIHILNVIVSGMLKPKQCIMQKAGPSWDFTESELL